MDLRLAQIFLAAAEELHFTRAAQRLNLSPPSVSEGVRRLEAEVGRALFVRTPRSVELTAAGRELVEPARALIRAHDVLESTIDDLSGVRTLTIGLLYGIRAPLVRAAGPLLREDPSLDLEVKVFDWSAPACGLDDGSTDAAILVGPTAFDAELVRRPIGRERRFALIPESAGVELDDDGAIPLSEVDRLGWVPVERHDEVWDSAWRLDAVRPGPPVTHGPAQSSLEGLIEAVQAGIGACVTVEDFGRVFTPEGIRILPVSDVPTLPVDLAHRQGHPRTDLVDALHGAVARVGGTSGAAQPHPAS